MKLFYELIKDSHGNPSSLRFCFIIWEFATLIAFFSVTILAIASYFIHPDRPYNPSTDLAWITGILAANRGSKIIQKPFEHKPSTIENATTYISKDK